MIDIYATYWLRRMTKDELIQELGKAAALLDTDDKTDSDEAHRLWREVSDELDMRKRHKLGLFWAAVFGLIAGLIFGGVL